MIKEILMSKIDEIIKAINEITTAFCKQKSNIGYMALNAILPTIMEVIDGMYMYKDELPIVEKKTEAILETLKNALDAMESKDEVLLSDILEYELLEQIEEMKKILK